MSVAHRFTWLLGLQSLTELKACSPLALYHCAVLHKGLKRGASVSLYTGRGGGRLETLTQLGVIFDHIPSLPP